MQKITYYLAINIVTYIFGAMLLLLGIETIFLLAQEMRNIGTGDYGLLQMFIYIALSLPQNIYQMFPMSALLGTMLGLGAMAQNNELVAIRNFGISVNGIAKKIMGLGLGLTLLIFIFGEVLAPKSDMFAHNYRANCLNSGQAITTNYGAWLKNSSPNAADEFVNIINIVNKDRIEGVTIYQFNSELDLISTKFAQHACYQDNKWVLHKVLETKLFNDYTQTSAYNSLAWNGVSPDILETLKIKYLDELSFAGILQTIDYRLQNNLDARPYQLALWQKIAQPFTILIMILLAIPFVFGPLRGSSTGFRLLIGILLGFTFKATNDLVGPVTLVCGVNPIIGAFLIPLIFFGFSMFLLNKSEKN